MQNKKFNFKFKDIKFLYLLIPSFFFIASFSLIFTSFYNFGTAKRKINDAVKNVETENRNKQIFPVINQDAVFPELSAYSVLAVDLGSNMSLFEKNSKNIIFPASTTKIITALVALDYYYPQEVLDVGNEINIEGQKMKLVVGEQMKVEDLLYGLLVYSANDASEVLAANYPGGRESFITSMNLKARELKLESSHFTNPSGLDDLGHVMTADDLVKIAEEAMKNSIFKKIVGTKQKTVYSVDNKISHKLVNLNELLGKVDGVLGIKTGWTENAKENLVTYVERNGERIIIVVLGSQNRFAETENLINWIFENYRWETN